jgi:hypothetical protein
MLAELKELTEWRERANENMKGLQKQLAAANARGDQLASELEKEKKERERAVEKVRREGERERGELSVLRPPFISILFSLKGLL